MLAVAACADPATSVDGADQLPVFDRGEFRTRLESSDRPTVVNAWGSWCLPCRSEAPVLVEAFEAYGDQVDFIGVAINDTQAGARSFIDEFGISYENQFDRDADIRAELGGLGAPITYFVAPGGEVIETHLGIIDGAQLAVGVDELLARS